MQRKTVRPANQSKARPRRAVASVVPVLVLVASAAIAQTALAQSGAITGSTLDSQANSESSLLSSGSFRLDGPSNYMSGDHNAGNEPSGDLHGGGTSLGLQIYGSGSSFSLPPMQPADAPASAVPPLGSSLGQP